MLFNSYGFIFLYLPIVLAGFFVIASRSHRLAALWLAASSVFFYGWWNPRFIALLLVSIAFNYGAGCLIGHARAPGRSKALLAEALVADLALLGVFKYANFFIATVDAAGARIGLLDIVLPLGISFFTFTQIAFLVDVHRGVAREYDFVHYLLFVTWFPHLIAGPVLHHKQMMPQFALPATYRFDAESFAVGATQFSLGLFKKVLLADQLATFADPIFEVAAAGGQPMLLESWIGALCYALQLYFDFSGYSDMAIGLSRMFNVKLPLNFNSPYKASSIIEFWRRWHMTLAGFLRDYVYISLGGNRKGPVRRHLNLMATMLLGGLWHGAGWNFVLWGGLHGAYLVINHGWRKLSGAGQVAHGRWTRAAGMLLTFTVVVIAWVPFRAANFSATLAMLDGMAGLNGISLPQRLAPVLAKLWPGHGTFTGLMPLAGGSESEVAIALPLGLMIVWLLPNTQQWLAAYRPAWDSVARPAGPLWNPTRAHAMLTGAVLALSLLSLNRVSDFLYFRF